MNTGLVFGSPIDGLLERLYAQNLAQDEVLAHYFTTRANEGSLEIILGGRRRRPSR